MKHILKIHLLFLFALYSCQKKNPEKKLEIIGHTFFKVQESKNGKILFKPCGAEIEKYIVYKDSIYHDLGQEKFYLNIITTANSENSNQFKTKYKYNGEVPETEDSLLIFKKLDKNQKFFKINNQIFVDSIYAKSLRIVKELPCDDDCYDCPKENALTEECKMKDLSKQFDLTLTGKYNKLENGSNQNPWSANIMVLKKNSDLVLQNISFTPESWVYFTSLQCDIISSADYNFDGFDDFAIMSDVGSITPVYSYYFQNKDKQFIEDQNFKFQNGPLPEKVDPKNKTLTFDSQRFQLKNETWEKIN